MEGISGWCSRYGSCFAERNELWKLHPFCFFRWVLAFPSSCLQYVWPHISGEAFLIPSEVTVSKNVIEKTSLLRIFFLRIVIKRETRAPSLKSTCYFPCGSHMCNIGMFLWIVCIFLSQTPVFKQMWKQHNTAVQGIFLFISRIYRFLKLHFQQ